MWRELKGHQRKCRLSSDLNYSLRTFLRLTCFTAQKPYVMQPQWKFLSLIFFFFFFYSVQRDRFSEIKTFQECILPNLPLTNANIQKFPCDFDTFFKYYDVIWELEWFLISAKLLILFIVIKKKIALNSNQIALISRLQGISQEHFFF